MAKYMATHYPLVLRCNNFVFMHGGPSRAVVRALAVKVQPKCVMSYLNTALYRMFFSASATMDKSVTRLAWERFFSKHVSGSKEEQLCSEVVDDVLRDIGVRQPRIGGMVLGHSIQKTLGSYCDGRVWRLDLGMSEAFGSMGLGGIRIVQQPGVARITTYHKEKSGSVKQSEYKLPR